MGKQRKKTRRDTAEIARSIVEQAIGELLTPREDEETESQAPDTRNQAAVALSKLGASTGGTARAKKLSKKRRSEIAKKAAHTRLRKPMQSNSLQITVIMVVIIALT